MLKRTLSKYPLFPVAALLLSIACGPQDKSQLSDIRENNMDYLSRELGDGFDSRTKKRLASCVDTQDITYSGQGVSRLVFKSDVSAEELINQTTVGLFGGVNFLGFVEAKVSGDIITTLADTDQSGALIYQFDIDGKSANISDIKLNAKGQSAYSDADPVKFREQCGDQFVHQVAMGARLFIALKYTFASREAKDKLFVELKGSALWGLIKFSKNWSKEKQDLLKDVRVSVEAFQIGGTVRDLENLKADTFKETGGKSMTCGSENAEKCRQVLDRFMDYAQNKFPKQLADMRFSFDRNMGPAVLGVNLVPYSRAGIMDQHGDYINVQDRPAPSPNLAAANAIATLDRIAIDVRIEKNRVAALQDFPFSNAEKDGLKNHLEKLNSFERLLQPAHQLCDLGLYDEGLAKSCLARAKELSDSQPKPFSVAPR